MHRRRATALLAETKKELADLEKEQERSMPKPAVLQEEASLFGIFVEEDDVPQSQQQQQQLRRKSTSIHRDASSHHQHQSSSPFRQRRNQNNNSSHQPFGGKGSMFLLGDTDDNNNEQNDSSDADHDEDGAAEEPPVSVFTEAMFLQFIEAGRKQANETMRRRTDAKLAAIAVLPAEERAAAYCESQIVKDDDFTLDDVQWHDPLEQSFSVMSKSVAQWHDKYNNNLNKTAAAAGGATSGSGVGNMSLSMVPSNFGLSIGGASSCGTNSTSTPQQFSMTQQQKQKQKNKPETAEEEEDSNNKQESNGGGDGVLLTSAYASNDAAIGRGEGLRQMRAAQSAAAIATQQQRKIVEWRNSDDADAFVEVKKENSYLRQHELVAFQEQQQRQRQQQRATAAAAHAAAPYQTSIKNVSLTSSMEGSSQASQQDHGKTTGRQQEGEKIERIPVGFKNMAVDETSFDAAVTALTMESQVVQKAGRRARWWELQRQNQLEKTFRDRVSSAVERGEKNLSASRAKDIALESLLPSAHSEAKVSAFVFAEKQARAAVNAAELTERNALMVAMQC